ncbi:hypothetical protein [Nitrospira sp. Kam-Ns4a]
MLSRIPEASPCASARADEVRAWLRRLPVFDEERVVVLWDDTTGLSVPWSVFVAY